LCAGPLARCQIGQRRHRPHQDGRWRHLSAPKGDRVGPGNCACRDEEPVDESSNSPSQEDAQAQVTQAIRDLASADVITRAAALENVCTAVRQQGDVSATQLVRAGLAALYKEDTQRIASLGDVESLAGPVAGAAFVDRRPFESRLETRPAAFSLTNWARAEPQLAAQLESLKNRIRLQHADDDTETFCEVVRGEAEIWLKYHDASAELRTAILESLEQWAETF
jgi:hypothetical protein